MLWLLLEDNEDYCRPSSRYNDIFREELHFHPHALCVQKILLNVSLSVKTSTQMHIMVCDLIDTPVP